MVVAFLAASVRNAKKEIPGIEIGSTKVHESLARAASIQSSVDADAGAGAGRQIG